MIKNFVVKVKQIKHKDKGLKNFLNYLENKKKHNDNIIKIKNFNKDTFFKNTILNITEYQLNKKCGRKIENYGDSFIFTIPPQLEEKGKKNLNILTKKLLEEIIKQLREQLEEEEKIINKNEIIKQIYINIHVDKKHIHFNVVFPRVLKINNKLVSNRITNRKKFLYNIKKRWTYIITKNLDLNITDYKTTTKFKKGYKNQYFKNLINKNNEVLKNIEKKEKNIKKLDEMIELKRKSIKEYTRKLIEEKEETITDIERKEKLINNFQLVIRYYKTIRTKFEKNEIKGLLKDINKINTKIKEVKELDEKRFLNSYLKDIEEDLINKRTYLSM